MMLFLDFKALIVHLDNRVIQSYHYSTIIVFIIHFIIFLMVINNGVINGHYLIKDHRGPLLC